MDVTIPNDIDILYIRTGAEKSMSLKVGEHMLGPVPAEGAFAKLGPMLVETRPELGDLAQINIMLMLLHFAFLSKGVNSHGLPYPYTGDALK